MPIQLYVLTGLKFMLSEQLIMDSILFVFCKISLKTLADFIVNTLFGMIYSSTPFSFK